MNLLPRTLSEATVPAGSEMGKQFDEDLLVRRRVEITVEREVVSYLRISGSGAAEIGERCSHCGQTIPIPLAMLPALSSAALSDGAGCAHDESPDQALATQLQNFKSENASLKDEVRK